MTVLICRGAPDVNLQGNNFNQINAPWIFWYLVGWVRLLWWWVTLYDICYTYMWMEQLVAHKMMGCQAPLFNSILIGYPEHPEALNQMSTQISVNVLAWFGCRSVGSYKCHARVCLQTIHMVATIKGKRFSYRSCELNGLGLLPKELWRGRGRIAAAALAGRGRVLAVALAGRGLRFGGAFAAPTNWRLIGVLSILRLNFFRAGDGALVPSRIREGVRKSGLDSVNKINAFQKCFQRAILCTTWSAQSFLKFGGKGSLLILPITPNKVWNLKSDILRSIDLPRSVLMWVRTWNVEFLTGLVDLMRFYWSTESDLVDLESLVILEDVSTLKCYRNIKFVKYHVFNIPNFSMSGYYKFSIST